MLKKLYRIATASSVVVACAVGVVAATTSPAFAGTTACVSTIQGGVSYSFQSYSFSLGSLHHVEIDVSRGGTCDGLILSGTVETDSNDPTHYNVSVDDYSCDNIGATIELHGYHLATTGCGHAVNSNPEPKISSIGSPKNFWLLVNGSWNTNAYNLPTVP
ncbi:MAG TPA: hypothetical protein VFI65_18535 [Streptosporangiaceae bacterium]|nr:hypothetical protein [Streptosporangiaceae bacterium]